jgi:hypothetical protein
MSVAQDIVKDEKKGGYNCKHKTELEVKDIPDWEVKFTSANKGYEFKAEY